jgi:excisionase family DNA binding protein
MLCMETQERYESPREIADRLDVSVSTVHRLIASGRLPAVHPTPRIVRVPSSAVDALLAERAAVDRKETP